MRAGRRFRFEIESHKRVTAGVCDTRPFPQNAKGRGTHSVREASEIKSLGHPPHHSERIVPVPSVPALLRITVPALLSPHYSSTALLYSYLRHPYCGFLLFCLRRIHRRINKDSKQTITAQIATPLRSFRLIAVTRAEMPNAKAIKIPKAAPIRVRNPRSCLTLTSITAEVTNCPAIDHQLAPMPAIYVVIGTPTPQQ